MMRHSRRASAATLSAAFAAAVLLSAPDLQAEPVWVFLRDKNVADDVALRSAIDAASGALSSAALARRDRRGTGATLSMSDLPVAAAYVDGLSALGADVRVQSRWLNAVSVDATPKELERIAALPFVSHLQPVVRVARPLALGGEELPAAPESTSDFYGVASSQLTQINVPAVHALGYTGAGMRIGVLDSGFKRTHVAFNHATRPINIVAERDFVEGDTFTGETTNNQHQHGTWVLGTMGAYQPNTIVGGAYDASFILAKTEVVPTETRVEEDYWVAGLEFLEANGADIVTSSLGYIDWYTQAQLNGNTAVTTLAARAAAQRGLVITNAAGNEGNDANPATSHLISPADADLIITVGAVDSAGNPASFTSDGPTADGRVKPELMARGVAAATVRSASDAGTTTVNGTSFATPLVAAAVTLVLQAHPDWTVEQLRHALFNTASRGGVFDPQFVNGYGIMNTLAAVQYSFDKYYTNASSGAFAVGSNWTSAGSPTGVHNVFITPTGSLTVAGPTASTRIHRLTIGATMPTALATLDLAGNAPFTIDDTLRIESTGRLLLASGTLTVRDTTTNHGTLDLRAGAELSRVVGNGSMSVGAGSVVTALSIEQSTLAIAGRVTLVPSMLPTVSRVELLDLGGAAAPAGTLDLGQNAMVIDYTSASPLAAIAAQVAYASNGGAWDRAGLTTSFAGASHGLGYAEAAALASVPAFFGATDSTALLIRYTLIGDADLSGSVEFADLLALAQNYDEAGSRFWFEGDFNYDGNVEFSDLLALAQNYGSALLSEGQLGALERAGGAAFSRDWALARAVVPEPALLALLPLIGGLSRRSRAR